MSIFVDKTTKVIVQGITGTQASFHVARSLEYGTNIVGGVTPGKGGTTHLDLPVFNTVKEAIAQTGATASIVFVPAKYAKSALVEGIEAGLDLIVCISDNIPIKDMLEVKSLLKKHQTTLIGPNTPGIIVPQETKLGIFPANIHNKGCVGVVSRSSTLTYEAVLEINRAGLGQSSVIGLGDDTIIGIDFIDVLAKFMLDEDTKVIVMVGQMSGNFEEEAAKWYKNQPYKKPIISFVAGNNALLSNKVGYAGDIVARGKTSAEDKQKAMKDAGFIVVEKINQIHQELIKLNAQCQS